MTSVTMFTQTDALGDAPRTADMDLSALVIRLRPIRQAQGFSRRSMSYGSTGRRDESMRMQG